MTTAAEHPAGRSPRVGDRVSRYLLTRQLGRGGMGVVFQARDERIGRDVADKLVRPEIVDSPEHLQRFEQEARAAGALNPPNILVLHDLGTHDGAGLEPSVVCRGRDIWAHNVDPQGRFLIVGVGEVAQVVPLDGGPSVVVEGAQRSGLYLNPAGRYLVSRLLETVVVNDLETGERLDLRPPGAGSVDRFFFDSAGRLLLPRGGVVSCWDPQTGLTWFLIRAGVKLVYELGDDGLLIGVSQDASDAGTFVVVGPEDGSRIALPQPHQGGVSLGRDRTGSIVVSSHRDGEVRVGRVFDDEPLLLLGHGRGETFAAVSQDGRWAISRGSDGTIRLWPMPDLDRNPIHALPYRELMAKLRALTNRRAVPDEESHTGYRVEPDDSAYRGWAEVPEW